MNAGSPAARALAYWNRHARHYDLSMRLFGGPMARAGELAGEAVRTAETVLEVAAGTGLLTLALAKTAGHVTATDYAPAMVEALRLRIDASGVGNVTCAPADVYALPFPPATFDAVVAANVLHLLPDLEGALAALHRVLRPGGTLVVPTFCHLESCLGRALFRLLWLTGLPGARRFSEASLRAAVEAAGFAVTRAESIPGPMVLGFVAAQKPT